MVRYREVEDAESGRTLLLTAGVVAGLLAGAVVAHRLGGWRGLRRALRAVQGRGAPALALLRELLPAGTLATILKAIRTDDLIAALLGQGERASRRRRRRRRAAEYDDDLDEYEVDEVERAAAGMHHDDEEEDDAEMDEADDDDEAADRVLGEADDEEVEDEADDASEDEDDEVDDIVEVLSPEAIEGAVLAAFRRHAVLRQRALEIAVDDDGVLELTGWVRSERELRTARRVAARVLGVEAVIVDVAVRDARPDRHPDTANATSA